MNRNLMMANYLRINSNMIRDLDNLQEQNGKDYTALVETINVLQDRIIHQKMVNINASN